MIFNILKYWRNSLADSSRLHKKIDTSALEISHDVLNSGVIDHDTTVKIVKLFKEANKTSKDLDNTDNTAIPVLICPYRLALNYCGCHYEKRDGNLDKEITPLWIPAKLSQHGKLQPIEGSLPWIARGLLDPTTKQGKTIGSIEDIEHYLSCTRTDDLWQDWHKFSNYCFNMLKSLPYGDLSFPEYTILTNAFIMPDTDIRGAELNNIKLLDYLIENNKTTPTLTRYASLSDMSIGPILNDQQEFKIASKHMGQMSSEFPLAPSQREALHHFLTLKNGEILAVNGPPGTGKTTLLHSIIANMWVEAAVFQTSPPVIVAVSANNQAVTNIIDSFGKVIKPKDILSERWLPEINSYGLYCPSSSAATRKNTTKFQIALSNDNNFPATSGLPGKLEDSKYFTLAETYFLDKCTKYFGISINSIVEAQSIIHKNLLQCLEPLSKLINEHNGKIKTKQNNLPFWLRLLYSLPPSVCKFIEQLLRLFNISDKLAKTSDIPEQSDVVFNKNNFFSKLDLEIRHKAFLLATHYWEARWLQEIQEMNFLSNQKKKLPLRDRVERKWRRYSMLTPCIVSTLYMLPSILTCWKRIDDGFEMEPLLEFADLLIVDESGQVTVELAAASFALTKKALLVGDILQIEPVWNINKAIDEGNLLKHKIISNRSQFAEIASKGITASEGCAMLIAQRASKYQKLDSSGNKYPERGMFLSEHRRCLDSIIDYCNKLAYNGRLKPMRGNEILNGGFPPIGYLHISGQSTKVGTSRKNDMEAEFILDWVLTNKEYLEYVYKNDMANKPIKDIIAIVTPFGAQKDLFHRLLLLDKYSSLQDITIGTVHALQGAERDVVIFSPVYSHQDGNPDGFFFNQGVQMLNVAVSRAKNSFLVFGNMDIFNPKSNKPSGLLAKFLFTNESNNLLIWEQISKVS
ncbi:conserved hypothetical protein [Desulfofarcimen acetoxidans DSM 771]|uniref:Uncharacterized protein n=1 Tax=Desulfofarcimen acetoxidans (strain ATCC 49208 / DSM 771 / KCTC 5769 / VKM B-1644 / 5575) TaxID=485916 RepID=C8W0I9_DESAS|nr:AAA domain-containing protein [Desulfofarcimen acetoxidans]ACV63244.1 conserved hypothetical protein [Desulfofarcimen acetoxidans DSM 771]